MRKSSPPSCCTCFPCVQTGVLSGVVKEEDLIHLPVLLNYSNSLFLSSLCLHVLLWIKCATSFQKFHWHDSYTVQEDASHYFSHRSLLLEFFFLYGDNWWCHSIDCLFVSGLQGWAWASSPVIILDRKASPCFSLHWRILHRYCFDLFGVWGEHFWPPPCVNFPIPKFSDDGHVPFFVSLLWHTVHVSWCSGYPNQHINLVIGLCHCCHGWLAAGDLAAIVLFTALKTVDAVSGWANIYGILTIHNSQSLWISIGPQSSKVSLVTTLCLVCTFTASDIVHCCYFVECLWLTGALILV